MIKISNIGKISGLLAALFVSPSVFALVGFGGGVELSMLNAEHQINSNDTTGDESIGIIATFEHPLPFVPNVRIENVTVAANQFKYNNFSITGYYELLDMDFIQIDAGAGLTSVNSPTFDGGDDLLDKYAFHTLLGAEVSLPLTSFSVYGTLQNALINDFSSIDASLGLKYTFDVIGVKPSINVGYRYLEANYDNINNEDVSLTTSGIFVSTKIAI